MHNFIMQWLDPISIVIGLIVTVPIFLTWYEVSLGRKRRHREWYKAARQGEVADAVLIVDLLAHEDMKPEVVKYLAGQNLTVTDDCIFEMNKHGELSPDILTEAVGELRGILADISKQASGSLHIFYGGPAAFAMIVGAELANKGNVHVYQRTHGKYSDWGPIRHAHF